MARNRLAFLLLGCVAAPALADVPLDRTDPGLAVRQAPAPDAPARAAPPMAQPAAPAAEAPLAGAGLLVTAVRVEGGDDLPATDLAAATASFVGHRLSQDDLQDLLLTISGVARAGGYVFARSSIPAQALDGGVLRVQLDEGHVDEVRLTGGDNRAVRSVLAVLQGHAPKRAEVERQLMLAGDLPGVTVGQAQFVREGEKGVLVVPVRYDRIAGRVSADNRGDHELGPERVQLQVDLNGLLTDRDQLTVSGLATPIQPRELKVASARYAYQLNDSGTEVAVFGSYGRTHSGGEWRRFDANGESGSAGLSITQPLLRGRKVSLWLAGELDYLAIDQWFSGDLARRDRIATANVSLNGYVPLAGGRLRAGVGVTQGLDVLGATGRGDPLASRPGADGRFTLFGAWANWAGDLVGPFSARLAVSGQLSTDPLLAVQQISIGGPAFGRAYDFSERSGDEGILGSAELQAKLWDRSSGVVRWVQLYTFGDAGRVTNLRNGFGTGTLYSAGVGARLNLPYAFKLGAEAAFPINADRYETGDKSPRISATVATAF